MTSSSRRAETLGLRTSPISFKWHRHFGGLLRGTNGPPQTRKSPRGDPSTKNQLLPNFRRGLTTASCSSPTTRAQEPRIPATARSANCLHKARLSSTPNQRSSSAGARDETAGTKPRRRSSSLLPRTVSSWPKRRRPWASVWAAKVSRWLFERCANASAASVVLPHAAVSPTGKTPALQI